MASAGDSSAPIRFRGPPAALAAVLTAPGEVATDFPLSLELPAAVCLPAPPRAFVTASSGTGAFVLNLGLPTGTPAGAYKGTLRVGGRSLHAVVEVEGDLQLRSSPQLIALEGAAGARPEILVSLVNLGNVDFSVPAAAGVGLYEVEGLENAIGRALRASGASKDGKNGHALVERVVEEAASGHGGLARVELRPPRAALAPAETFDVRLVFTLPSGLKADRRYSGTLFLGNLAMAVTVDVPSGGSDRKKESR